MAKKRLDALMVERALAENPTKAQAIIMSGLVYCGEEKLDKAGHTYPEDMPIEIREKSHPWVSRGGIKLAHGLSHFSVNPASQIIADIGSSTGGFTDVLLQAGAQKVYAVDVGRGQLDWGLRNDPRVVSYEELNAKLLTCEHIPDTLDGIVCDASFIKLMYVLPTVLEMAPAGAWLIALIKPQFEVEKKLVFKGGVVRDEAVHQRVCEEVHAWLESIGWRVQGLTASPIHGPKGNKEFLIHAIKE